MNLCKLGLVLVCGMGALTSLARLYGDTPDETHAWAVHDMNCPSPVKISAEPGQPPSDAIVLFDGIDLDAWESAKKGGGPAPWKLVEGGGMEVVPGSGPIKTKASFGDCQLHVEWAAPREVVGMGQGRGNSGVFLMGNYEIQILDSYATWLRPDGSNANPNYADGQAGSVYAENPPLVNACRAPGEWQSFDIIFHQPVWEGETLKYPGSVTLIHNGVVVQDHWEMEGLTTHCRRRPLKPHPDKLPLTLQDHKNPNQFRNIWIREIPSRYANTVHGGPAVDKQDVRELREKIARELLTKIKPGDESRINNLEVMLEVISYHKKAQYMTMLDELSKAYLDELKSLDIVNMGQRKSEVLGLKKSIDVLARCNVIADDFPLKQKVAKIIKVNQFNKKK
jgi:hypothetical protein